MSESFREFDLITHLVTIRLVCVNMLFQQIHFLILFALLLIAVTCRQNDNQNRILSFKRTQSQNTWENLGGFSQEDLSNGSPFHPAEPLTPSEFQAAKFLSFHEGESDPKPSLSKLEKQRFLRSRNGVLDKSLKWPGGIVPYVIGADFDAKYRLIIAKSMSEFHNRTCIRFVPRRKQEDYVYISGSGDSCDSDAGRVGGRQVVSLGQDCDSVSIVVHELNHAIGFWHEQNRFDRDKYVTIHWDNIYRDSWFNFDKMKPDEITHFGVPYDTNSIMHYDKWSFSKQHGLLPVMTPHVPNPKMGLATRLSNADVKKIRIMYQCAAKKRSQRPGNGKPKPR